MKPGIVFYKMTGSGNDFIALDGRYVAVEQVSPTLVSGLCDRRRGAGAAFPWPSSTSLRGVGRPVAISTDCFASLAMTYKKHTLQTAPVL